MQRKTVLVSLAIVTILVLASLSIAVIMVNVDENNGEKEVINEEMRIKGIARDGIEVYKNIPYAEPPVGELRFAAPVLKEADWTEIRDCTHWGNIPIQSHQYTSEYDRSTYHAENENEDCLNLNLFVPAGAKPGDKLPVYVWIYGGGFMSGDSTSYKYDGTRFAQEGVIVVSFNYRVGALGFLCLDSLKTSENGSGNWGTLDQICALKWVQKYIERFGGDKNNVTIGGESAGSFSVFNLVMSKKAEGLFQKAIMESGVDCHMFRAQKSYDGALASGRALAAKFGADDSLDGVAKLRQADPYLMSNETDMNNYMSKNNDNCVWPTRDGIVLPEDFWNAIDSGEFNNVKMIIGYNAFEGLIFTNPDETEEGVNNLIRSNFPEEHFQEVRDYYTEKEQKLGMTTYACAAELTAMGMFKLCIDKAQKAFYEKGATVYCYQFFHKTLGSDKVPHHGVEIDYTFGHDTVYGVKMTDEDKVIMEQMHGHWLNFIKTGDPNGKGLAQWDKYNKYDDLVMSYGQKLTTMMPKQEVKVLDTLSPWYFDTSVTKIDDHATV